MFFGAKAMEGEEKSPVASSCVQIVPSPISCFSSSSGLKRTVPEVKIIETGNSDSEQTKAWEVLRRFMQTKNGKLAFHSGGNLPLKNNKDESQ